MRTHDDGLQLAILAMPAALVALDVRAFADVQPGRTTIYLDPTLGQHDRDAAVARLARQLPPG